MSRRSTPRGAGGRSSPSPARSANGRDSVATNLPLRDPEDGRPYLQEAPGGQPRRPHPLRPGQGAGLEERISIVSFGAERGLCTESTEECWSKNRRAIFLVRSEEHTSELQSRPHLVCR